MQQMNESLARQACADLIAQYAYLNDERRFDELVDLFTDDALLYRPSAPEQAIAGRAAILEAFRKRPVDTMTFHVTSDVLIEVESAESARGRSRILLLSGTRPENASGRPADVTAPVPGVFRDRFRLTQHGWKFSERRGMFWI
ncbi:MAG: nuclear transport factor 2 family protein [Telluria sp.]